MIVPSVYHAVFHLYLAIRIFFHALNPEMTDISIEKSKRGLKLNTSKLLPVNGQVKQQFLSLAAPIAITFIRISNT